MRLVHLGPVDARAQQARSRRPGLSPPGSRLAVLLALTALALGGCGGTGAGGRPLQRAVSAANRTLALPGVSYDLALSGSTIFGARPEPLRARGAFDFPARFGYEAIALPATAKQSAQKLFFDFLPAAFLVAPTPPPPRTLPDGASWISVPLKGPRASRDKALAAQIEGLAPQLALDEVSWGARAASSLGGRVVNQVPMHEYRVSIDLGRALAAARKAGDDTVAAAIEHEQAALRAGGDGPYPSVMLWINGPGYVGRLESTSTGSGLGGTSFTFTSFSVKIPKSVPLPSQTVPLSSLAGAGRPSRSLWATAVSG